MISLYAESYIKCGDKHNYWHYQRHYVHAVRQVADDRRVVQKRATPENKHYDIQDLLTCPIASIFNE